MPRNISSWNPIKKYPAGLKSAWSLLTTLERTTFLRIGNVLEAFFHYLYGLLELWQSIGSISYFGITLSVAGTYNRDISSV